MRRITDLAILAVLLSTGAWPLSAQAQCTGPNHVVWPAADPVWDFCWTRPAQSSGSRGSGLELTNVKFRGVTILKTAHMPILNVKYAPGGCGCFRDWYDEERRFECAPSPSAGYCDGTTTPVSTVCDHPGTDAGTFLGVGVEDLGTSLLLTSQCSAGWYRYISVWEFKADGTIRARMDASATNNSCVASTHNHHGYWRLDFDVDGPGNDFVDHASSSGGPLSRVLTESNFIDTSPNRSRWQVGSVGSTALVEVIRNDGDGATGDGDPPGVPGDFPRADGWVVAYRSNEIDDAPTGLSDCPAKLNNFLNSEDVDDADVVVWVRAAALHVGEAGGISNSCFMFGPTIRVINPNELPTPTVTGTRPAIAAPTLTATGTPTPTDTPAVTDTPANTHSPTIPPTSTPEPSATATETSIPTETPSPSATLAATPSDRPRLVEPLLAEQTVVECTGVLPSGSLAWVTLASSPDSMLGNGIADSDGHAVVALIRPLEMDEHVMCSNRSMHIEGFVSVVLGAPSPTATSVPTVAPSPTSTPAPALLGMPQAKATGLAVLLVLLAAGLWLTRKPPATED